MTDRIPLVRPQLGDAEVEATERVIRSGWVTQGPEVAAFECEFAGAVGSQDAVAVSNCTVGLELALRALDVGTGDEVITVSHSFIATANAVVHTGALPVFVDVEESTWGMSAAALEEAITPKTKAIMCVHQVGIPCDLPGILEVARKHDLPVVEDAACAIGSQIHIDGRWQAVGAPHGNLACFSLHPRKVVTTGDGGVITCKSEAMGKKLRLFRQHAMSVSDVQRHQTDDVVFEEYLFPAFNARMTDIQAAVGRPQIARLSDIITERRALADRYVIALAECSVLEAPRDPRGARCNWQSYPCRLVEGADQRHVMRQLIAAGVSCKRGVSNAHQEPAYKNHPGIRHDLSVSEKLRDTTVLLPLFHGMTLDEQEHVIAACLALKA